jgi:flagellar motor switch protein FliM
MEDLLNQNDIDNLLNDFQQGGDLPTTQMKITSQDKSPYHPGIKRSSSEIANYDFRRPNRISKNQVRTIQNVHDTFAEVFGYYLVSKLQTMATINVTSVDQLFYSEYILSVSNPSCLYVFDILGTDGSGILEINPQLSLCLVERLLGGSADQPRKPRAITPIEQAVMKSVVETIFSDLSSAWSAIAELKFRYNRFESEADFVQIAPSSEIVVVVSLDVNIGLNSYMMNFCFPTFALEDVIARLNRMSVTSSSGSHNNPERERENIRMMKQQLASQYMSVGCELGKATIELHQLLELNVGDVIKLDTKINQEVMISLDGKLKLAGRPGTVDGKKAIRITRQLIEDDMVEPNIWYNNDDI